MTARWLRLREVCAAFRVDDDLLQLACAEGLVAVKESSEAEAVISAEDAERLRLIGVLMRDLEVNLAGVEVILHMHADLCSRQRQFDAVLRSLVEALRQRLGDA